MKTESFSMLPLLEVLSSKGFFKKKKQPTTQRAEEPMTLNEFDINAAVTKLRLKKNSQHPTIV